MAQMSEEEIESWYEDQKQKLLDDYLLKLEQGKSKDASEKEYTEAFNQLAAKYRETEEKFLTQKRKGGFSLSVIKEKILAKLGR